MEGTLKTLQSSISCELPHVSSDILQAHGGCVHDMEGALRALGPRLSIHCYGVTALELRSSCATRFGSNLVFDRSSLISCLLLVSHNECNKCQGTLVSCILSHAYVPDCSYYCVSMYGE
ncbi:hypothetical protein M378DRAFT_172106 [Amanita muscaria Koide BX008]|uniref:Uncharacterized protein n=1 Tax=Amanita muscaria (strain Koide BX008) TaxID=946122 RepID=A0A0C2ST00_AMAMK|nr:hypothetical protein M378DRAFT_172106 [Amanita muscaria Koide BX008]